MYHRKQRRRNRLPVQFQGRLPAAPRRPWLPNRRRHRKSNSRFRQGLPPRPRGR